MKNLISIFSAKGCMAAFIFLFIASGTVMAQEVQSDYEIQQNFKNTYKSLNTEIRRADSSGTLEGIITEIKQMEGTYRKHSELLNKVLYPETFEDEMTELKRNALSTRKRLATIERQSSKLQELSSTVSSYDSRIKTLNSRTDSLRQAMAKSIQSEKQLTDRVRSYRKALEQRDELILSFVDSVMIAYRKVDYGSIQDLETVKKRARFNANGNALRMIRNIISENIELISTSPDHSTEEYLRMNAVQHEFATMWSKLSNDIIETYGKGDTDKKAISDSISVWGEKIDGLTWTSLNRSFSQAGIALPKFTESQNFYNTLKNYINQSIKDSKEGSSDKLYEDYRKLNEFWTDPVQTQWSTYMVRGDIMSPRQITSIDSLLEQWKETARPQSNLLVYLLGASVLAVVVLGVMLAREKTVKKS